MISRILKSRNARPCHILDDGVQKTVPGLSVTPSQIAKMSEKGIPVSTPTAEQFFDGTFNPSFDIPIEDRRGTDINDVWTASKEAKARILDAHRKDKEKYG